MFFSNVGIEVVDVLAKSFTHFFPFLFVFDEIDPIFIGANVNEGGVEKMANLIPDIFHKLDGLWVGEI